MKASYLFHLMFASLLGWSFMATAQVSDFELKENMTLHYSINGSMDFKVKLLELGDQVRFVWYKGDTKGFEVVLTPKAMEDAVIQLNHIYGMVGMPPQKYSNATSVFFSRQLMKDIENEEEIVIYPYMDGEDSPVEVRKWDDGSVKVDDLKTGERIEIPATVVEGSGGEVFFVLKNERFPLILAQELDFTIDLMAIEY